MGDPMAMATSMMAMQGQARSWIDATTTALAAAGRGFSAEDRDAIAASHAAHPYPSGYGPGAGATPADLAAAQDLAARAMSATYPPDGLAPDDPRLVAVDGITLAIMAIGMKAIGWSTDPVYTGRVLRALGLEPEVWERATTVLRDRMADDVVLSAFYGQLFAAA